MTARPAYTAAGVDVEAADRAVELLRSRLRVSDNDVLGGIGGFGAAFELPGGYRAPVLISSTDGVGTKTEIARQLGRYDTIGRDLVAMCADDIVCHGARPLFFLDYLAVGRVQPDTIGTLVGGIADACDEIGCALIGGETAEHPGVMGDDAFDLAGFCVGIVERDELIDGSAAADGDALLGMASSGLHANGYSLVRRLLAIGALPLDERLLTPTRLYTNAVLRLIDDLGVDGAPVRGLAHVTGGGLSGNVPRAVSPSHGVVIDPSAWPLPELFADVAKGADMSGPELRSTFNCGIGMIAVVEPRALDAALRSLAASGIEAWVIGRVVEAQAGAPRYVEVA